MEFRLLVFAFSRGLELRSTHGLVRLLEYYIKSYLSTGYSNHKRKLSRTLKIVKELMRFFGMWAPSQSLRIAMYRKAGIRIGRVHAFGNGIWLDIPEGPHLKNMISIEDNVHLAGYCKVLCHSFMLYGYEEEGISPVIIRKGARIAYNALILYYNICLIILFNKFFLDLKSSYFTFNLC